MLASEPCCPATEELEPRKRYVPVRHVSSRILIYLQAPVMAGCKPGEMTRSEACIVFSSTDQNLDSAV